MLRTGAFVFLLLALVLCASLDRLAAEEVALVNGTKAITIRLDKDQEFPEGAAALMAVDIVGKISEPVKTGIVIMNVRLVALD